MTGELRTKGGVLVATGWERVVSNDHPHHKGPYVEFHWRQATDNMSLAFGYRWRDASNHYVRWMSKHVNHDDWVANDGCKLFQQIREVGQADFRPGYFYIKLKDLSDESKEKLDVETYIEGGL